MVDLLLFCLGGALFSAVIFFPLTYVAMRSLVRFRGGLGKAWRPFGYSILLLTGAKMVEISTRGRQDVDTVAGLVWFLLVPILISAVVLYFTYRDRTVTAPPRDGGA